MESNISKKINLIIILHVFIILMDVIYFYLLFVGFGSDYRFISKISTNNIAIIGWILISIILVFYGYKINRKLKMLTGKRNNVISILSIIIIIPIILAILGIIYFVRNFHF